MSAARHLDARGRGAVLTMPGIGRCALCGQHERLSRAGRCKECRNVSAKLLGAVVDPITPWERDDRCWYLVAHHPDGLTLEQVSDVMGITRERVRQIEAAALKKFARSMKRLRTEGEVELDDYADRFGWAEDEIEGRIDALLEAGKGKRPSDTTQHGGQQHAHGGRSLTLAEWGKEPDLVALGVSETVLRARLSAGWPFGRAISEPKHRTTPRSKRRPVRDPHAPPAVIVRSASSRARAAEEEAGMSNEAAPEEGRVITEQRGSKLVTLIEYGGRLQSAYAWAQEPEVAALGISGAGIKNRVDQGWTVRDALTKPKGSEGGRKVATQKRAKRTAERKNALRELDERFEMAREAAAEAPPPASPAQAPTAAQAVASNEVWAAYAPLVLLREQIRAHEAQLDAMKRAERALSDAYGTASDYAEAAE